MLTELELLVRTKEAQTQMQMAKIHSTINSSGKYIDHIKKEDKAPVIMGGQIINEEEFADEELCQICCAMKQNTRFLPCLHMTCKKCIQTHMLNNEKCPFCNSEIKEL